MTDIDEAMLIAWVDGELDEVTRRRVDRAVADDPALAERLAMHRRLRERLSGHYAPIAAEPDATHTGGRRFAFPPSPAYNACGRRLGLFRRLAAGLGRCALVPAASYD